VYVSRQAPRIFAELIALFSAAFDDSFMSSYFLTQIE